MCIRDRDMTEDMMKSGNMYQTQYVIWNNFGMEKEDMDIETYRLNAEVMDLSLIHI